MRTKLVLKEGRRRASYVPFPSVWVGGRDVHADAAPQLNGIVGEKGGGGVVEGVFQVCGQALRHRGHSVQRASCSSRARKTPHGPRRRRPPPNPPALSAHTPPTHPPRLVSGPPRCRWVAAKRPCTGVSGAPCNNRLVARAAARWGDEQRRAAAPRGGGALPPAVEAPVPRGAQVCGWERGVVACSAANDEPWLMLAFC